ncbi:MAG: DUF1800 domain-containing protein [Pseudomonadota bacterium]
MIEAATLSALRFGFGHHPAESAPASADALLESIGLPPPPRIPLSDRTALFEAYRKNRQDQTSMAAENAKRALNHAVRDDLRHAVRLAVRGPGFRERLTHFWLDHFTVAARGRLLSLLVPDFVDRVIRPHIDGTFPTMLEAVAEHPAMLLYLNQANSVGPNSQVGQRRGRGLNENLAREVLELHTIGVDAAYTQRDVRELARLLTGLGTDKTGFRFRQGIAEPGQMEVLGQTYRRSEPDLQSIRTALRDIALRPETARHLSKKLYRHFVGAPVDPGAIQAMAKAYRANDGALLPVYQAMLAHPSAWERPLSNAKLPFHFIVSTFRAAGATEDDIEGMSRGNIQKGIHTPMINMGQRPFQPRGPDGWSEEPTAWITPPMLATRIRWAAEFAQRLLAKKDPREFLEDALGDAASDLLRFAVAGSEQRVEGIALTLVSPEFNRR